MTTELSSVIGILERLVAFPTVPDRSNAGMIAFIADLLDRHRIPHQIFPGSSGEKLGLIAHVGPATEGGVIAAQLTRQITRDNDSQLVSYQTEAGHFQAAGYSTAICSPGNIEQAHGPDEFASAAQLRQEQAVLSRLIQKLC